MATALGGLLIFELNGGRARGFELHDRSLDLKGIAKAGVGIDDQRQSAGPRQVSRLLGQLRERE